MKSALERAKDIFQQHGSLLKTSEAIKAGVHPSTLYAMRDSRVIEQVGRGLFRMAGRRFFMEELSTTSQRWDQYLFQAVLPSSDRSPNFLYKQPLLFNGTLFPLLGKNSSCSDKDHECLGKIFSSGMSCIGSNVNLRFEFLPFFKTMPRTKSAGKFLASDQSTVQVSHCMTIFVP